VLFIKGMRYPLLFSKGESPVVIDFDKFKWLPYREQCSTAVTLSRREKVGIKQICEILLALTGVKLDPCEVRKVGGFIPTFTTTSREAQPQAVPSLRDAEDIIAFYSKKR